MKSTHTRAPRYCRGRVGTIHAVHGGFVFPDSSAAGLGDKPQPLGSLKLAQNGTAYTPHQVNTLARGLRYQCAEGDVLDTHPIMPALARLIDKTGGEAVPLVDRFWSV